MKRLTLAIPVALVAAAFAGCTTPGPNSPANTSAAPAAQPVAYWAGTGVVQSVNPAPGRLNAGPSAGGSTAAAQSPSARSPVASTSDSGLYRLGIRMDNGRMMYVDTSSRDFSPGTRVQITDNNEIRRM